MIHLCHSSRYARAHPREQKSFRRETKRKVKQQSLYRCFNLTDLNVLAFKSFLNVITQPISLYIFQKSFKEHDDTTVERDTDVRKLISYSFSFHSI